MKLATKNFRLNSLANQYAVALLNHVRRQNGGEWFTINADTSPIRVEVLNGASGMREIVDAYVLYAVKQGYQGWEAAGITVLARCVDGTGLTNAGLDIWQSMVNDMGYAAANQEPRHE